MSRRSLIAHSPVARGLAVVLVMAALLPTTAVARSESAWCSDLRAVPFAADVPDEVRTPGRHRFEWRSTFSNPDGSPASETVGNEITIVDGASLYPSTVLMRLVRNTALLADGEVVAVTEMAPDQPAAFYAAAFGGPDERIFLDGFRLWLRYETAKNRWSPWVELPRGPETSLCNQVTSAAWKKAYGWD